MNFNIILSINAKDHTQDAYEYYESEQLFLGDRFLTTLEKHYEELRIHPQHYSFLTEKKDLRFLVVDRFPFIIVFQIEADKVLIIDVHNTHQNPDKLFKQIP